MTKEELYEIIEKNLKDFEAAKIKSVKPNGEPLAMDNFDFYCMCFMPCIEKIRSCKDYTKKDELKISQLENEFYRIKKMPFILLKLNYETNELTTTKINFEENKDE